MAATAGPRRPALEQEEVWVERRVGKRASEERVVRNGRGFGATMAVAAIGRGNDRRPPV